MKLSEVKNILLETLIPLENEYGYKVNKGKFALIKKEKTHTSGLYFTENHWLDEIQIMPAICVDVKEINIIWAKFDNHIGYTYFMNLRELKDWYDVGKVDRNKFKVQDYNKYKIFNYDKDLTSASIDIQNLFKTYGIKYVNDFSNSEGVDKLYNTNLLETNNPHCSGFQVRSIVGLIAAKLSGNPNYKVITDFYSDLLEKHKLENTMNLEDIERFYRIKEYLG